MCVTSVLYTYVHVVCAHAGVIRVSHLHVIHVCAGSMCAGVLHVYTSVSTRLHVYMPTQACMCVCVNACFFVHVCLWVHACTLVTGMRKPSAPQQVRALMCKAGAPQNGQHCVIPAPTVYPPALPLLHQSLDSGPRYPRPAPEGGQQRQSRRGMSPRAWITHPPAGRLPAKPQQLPGPPFPHLQNGDNQSTTLTGRP